MTHEPGLHRRDLVLGAAALAAAAPGLARAAAAPPPTPSAVGALRSASLGDLEDQARKVLGGGAVAFAADGSGAEWTLHENRRAFDRYEIIPEYLAGRAAPDLRTSILGASLSLPVFTAPMGAQGVIHASADVGMAQGTAASGTLMTLSGASTRSIEEVAAAFPDQPAVQQVVAFLREGGERAICTPRAGRDDEA